MNVLLLMADIVICEDVLPIAKMTMKNCLSSKMIHKTSIFQDYFFNYVLNYDGNGRLAVFNDESTDFVVFMLGMIPDALIDW